MGSLWRGDALIQLITLITGVSSSFQQRGAAVTALKSLNDGVMFLEMLSSDLRTGCPVSSTEELFEAQVSHSLAERLKRGAARSRSEVLMLPELHSFGTKLIKSKPNVKLTPKLQL